MDHEVVPWSEGIFPWSHFMATLWWSVFFLKRNTLVILWWNIRKNRIENRTFLDLVVVVCWFHACIYIYIGPPNWVQYWVRVVNNSWRCSPISFKHVYLWCLLVGPHWTTYQSNLGVRLKKWATYEPLTSWMSEWVPFRNYTLRIQICSLYIFLIYVGCYFIVTHTHCKNVQWRVHPLDIKISSDQDYVLLL